ncbi:MAG: cellulose biosynthesis protein BcsS [Rhizobiales bacterium]|nr:cellulose biosynthesis protein BcsS [Hyphomicrobiales bacterium]
MVRVRYQVAAIVIAAAMGSVDVPAGALEDALAQDWFWSPSPSRSQEQVRRPKRSGRDKKDREHIQLLFSSGIDIWRHSAFAYDAVLWTPFGAGNDGVIFKAVASSGSYRYRAGSLGNAEVTGWMAGAAVMPGVHFTRGGVSVAAYFGADIQVHYLTPFDPGNELYGRRLGIRTAVDLWAEPTPRSMVAASATLTTIGGHYATRAAAGWRLFGRFYLGPEAIAFGGPDYRQLRVGVHVTGLRTELFDWRFEWQAGVGYAFDDDDNSGAYARLGILWRH